jgi:hypothetical protein
MSKTEITRDLTVEGMKAAPPTAIAALTANEWVAIATICYIILQAAYLVWKWRREAGHHKRGGDS